MGRGEGLTVPETNEIIEVTSDHFLAGEWELVYRPKMLVAGNDGPAAHRIRILSYEKVTP